MTTPLDSALSAPSQESRNCLSVFTRLLSTGWRGTGLAGAPLDPPPETAAVTAVPATPDSGASADSNTGLWSIIVTCGRNQRQIYDSNTGLWSITVTCGGNQRQIYDSNTELPSITVPCGGNQRQIYDSNTGLWSITVTCGGNQRQIYDSNTELPSITVPCGRNEEDRSLCLSSFQIDKEFSLIYKDTSTCHTCMIFIPSILLVGLRSAALHWHMLHSHISPLPPLTCEFNFTMPNAWDHR